MAVQKLNNAAMNPGEKLRALETFWQPARVKVGEEITMWPAEVFNMGLLRSAWGRHAKCELDMDEYRLKCNLWGENTVGVGARRPLADAARPHRFSVRHEGDADAAGRERRADFD